jgi:hypothetical protein
MLFSERGEGHVRQTKSNLQGWSIRSHTKRREVECVGNAEVEITIHDPYVVPATATSDEERERALRELMESWQQHPLTGDAPRLTRDELHERR